MHKARLNLRAILTVTGSALLAFSIMAFFEWGVAATLMFAAAGLALVVFGQTRPKQRGGRRWH
jgi:uncharacterized protein (DUF58 family)